MTTLTVYDPAMCCSTGICGAEVDQQLVTFAADLDWLKGRGIDVTRINLSQEPAAFAENEAVKSVLQNDGVEGLPVILLGDRMHSSGRYPARGELAEMAGVEFAADDALPAAQTQSGGCCGGSAAKDASSCC
jgi:glutaredoxin